MHPLPPGQYEAPFFPRFGMTAFAERFPKQPDRIELQIVCGAARASLSEGLARLPRVEQVSDFHCVTTWSCRSLAWSGYRFRDVFEAFVAPLLARREEARIVTLRGQDGYRSSLPLDDLMADDVLLADRLDGKPLGIAHGAPIRLVAPAHYGYKSVKHLCGIVLVRDERDARPSGPRFMQHPRARVALEERGGLPGPLLRWLYRPLVRPTVARFARALRQHGGAPQMR